MTENVCGATKRDGSGEECQLPAGWGTDNDSGRCKYHGGAGGTNADGSSHEGNDYAAKAGAWADDFFDGFLTEEEQRRVKEGVEVLGEDAGAQELGRFAAMLALEQFRRTGDDRFMRRYESICDKAGIFPDERKEVEMTGEGGGPLEVTVNREAYESDE